jgi:hypothetical protein
MPTLWSFGDSFSEILPDKRCYTTIIAKSLNLDLMPRIVTGGTSLQYLFDVQWGLHEQMQPGDRVIICLTNTFRSYLIKDNPRASNPKSPNMKDVDPAKAKALKSYYQHLHDQKDILLYLRAWFYHLDAICKRIHTKAVVMDIFDSDGPKTKDIDSSMHDNIIRGMGYLNDVSIAECANMDTFNHVQHTMDLLRDNHLSVPNHEILADKIIQAWKSNSLDLTQNFVSKCFDIHRVKDPV